MVTDDALRLRGSKEQLAGPRRSHRSRHVLGDETWDLHSEEIYRIYVEQNNTLSQTMRMMEDTHGFKASKRKYKMKLNEWKFDKNLPSNNMRIVVAKASKRAAEEGKETVFYSSGQEINADRIENFKKRMKLDRVGIAPLSAVTPPNITYHTPRADHNASIPKEAESVTSCPDDAPKLAKSISDLSPEDVHTPSRQDELTFLDNDQLSLIQEDSVEKHSDLGDEENVVAQWNRIH